MNTIIKKLLEPDIIVIFDTDGVLAPYEWGKNNRHCMPDAEWDERLEQHEDIYKCIRPVKVFQDFIKQKDIKTIFVCSKSGQVELESKTDFCKDNYGILAENIQFVKDKADKLCVLDKICDSLNVPEDKIAIVEDTVKTLNMIATDRDYITVHVSSFLD